MRGKERNAREVARDTSTVPESAKSVGGNCGLRRAIEGEWRSLASGDERGNGGGEPGEIGGVVAGQLSIGRKVGWRRFPLRRFQREGDGG
jgi:hypothetical protein